MAGLTLLKLVANGTMDADTAALLWTVAEEKRGLITAAVPRKAGKSTVLEAVLEFAPDGTPLHRLDGTLEQIVDFQGRPDGGYLVAGEFAHGGPSQYIWGEKVQAYFRALEAGFSLATSLHAPGVNEVFEQICDDNGIGDEDASRVEYVVYVERAGDADDNYVRRVMNVHEIDGVTAGKPAARELHRRDRFDGGLERTGEPRRLTAGPAELARRASAIRETVAAGRTGPAAEAKLKAAP